MGADSERLHSPRQQPRPFRQAGLLRVYPDGMSSSQLPKERLTLYLDGAGLWRWNVKARNHRIIGASEQGHRSRRRALRKALRQFPDAVLVEA